VGGQQVAGRNRRPCSWPCPHERRARTCCAAGRGLPRSFAGVLAGERCAARVRRSTSCHHGAQLGRRSPTRGGGCTAVARAAVRAQREQVRRATWSVTGIHTAGGRMRCSVTVRGPRGTRVGAHPLVSCCTPTSGTGRAGYAAHTRPLLPTDGWCGERAWDRVAAYARHPHPALGRRASGAPCRLPGSVCVSSCGANSWVPQGSVAAGTRARGNPTDGRPRPLVHFKGPAGQ
jgi:hypothetical protein